MADWIDRLFSNPWVIIGVILFIVASIGLVLVRLEITLKHTKTLLGVKKDEKDGDDESH